MAGEAINRQDIITDEALNAPLLMSANFEVLLKTMEKVQSSGKQSETMINAAKSTTELKNETAKLTATQTELEKIQRQFATSTQRLSDEYLSNKRALQAVNDEAKARLQLGDREARQVNAQNASLKVLEAALQKNRKAYADLSSEQARASKNGQELLKVITAQDKEVKALNESMGKHQDSVGNYAKGMAALDARLGGVIGSLKETGKQLMALALNPFVATAAVLIGLFAAMKSAAEAYYEATLKGEEEYRKEMLKDESSMKMYKGLWEQLGEAAANTWASMKEVMRVRETALMGPENAKIMQERMALAEKAAKQQSQNIKDHIKDVVDDARTELEVNEQLAISKDKLNFKAEERQEALKVAVHWLEQQLEGDLELARNDLKAEEDRLASLGKKVIEGKLLADYSDEELEATKMNSTELGKLRDLQTVIIKLESDMAEKRKGFHKQEFALAEEIRKEKEDAAKEEEARNAKLLKAEFDQEKKAEDEELRLKKESDARHADLEKVKASNRKAAYDQWVADAKAANEAIDEAAQEEFDREMQRIEDEKNARLELYDLIARSAEVAQQGLMVFFDWTANLAQYRQSMYQKELKALDDRTKRELKLAGDNEAAKIKIEEEAEKRREEINKKIAEEKNKQAKIQRAAEIVQAGVTFAQAILAALAGGPPPFNLALASITAAIAGIQVLAVSSAPIPQYAKGGKAKGGLAIVGEEGVELMKSDGQFSLSPSGPTLMNLKKDTEIIPHEQTMRMLALSSIGTESLVEKENAALLGEIKDLKATVATYSDKIAEAVVQNGNNLFEQGSLIYRNQKRADGSRNIIRQKNLSA